MYAIFVSVYLIKFGEMKDANYNFAKNADQFIWIFYKTDIIRDNLMKK